MLLSLLFLGSADFFALNHYTTYLAKDEAAANSTFFEKESGVALSQDPNWEYTTMKNHKVCILT